MPRLYKHSKIAKRILYKMRHHKGHGIHSPFVFSLVNDVIEEKRPYYSYEDLQKHTERYTQKQYKINKANRLSFRLANFFNVRQVLELGSGQSLDSLFLTAHSTLAHCYCFENNKTDRKFAAEIIEGRNANISFLNDFQDILTIDTIDCLSIDLTKLTREQKLFLQNNKNKYRINSYILVRNIRQTKENHKVWKSLTEIENRTAILDLFNIGIILFNPQLYKWCYQISF